MSESTRTVALTPTAVAKLQRLLAAVEAAQQQLATFLHGYLAAQGIEEAVVEQIDLASGTLVIHLACPEGN